MSVLIHVSGEVEQAVKRLVPRFVEDMLASGIAAQDPALWGPDAESEASIRLGWTEAAQISRALLPRLRELRARFDAEGIDHYVLAGMGGSSLAPEVITRTMGVELTVLDSTAPQQVAAALNDRLASTVLVVSSKSGSTLETDSQRRAYEQAFRSAGIDPASRIVVVTDPGSPLEKFAVEAGYEVFQADPNVGGRYSALTAFGIVPSALAGVDVEELLDEADAIALYLATDDADNPGLILGAAIAGTQPLRDKLGIVSDGTHIRGFADWAEQLIAESTGKLGRGLLPVVLDTDSPELSGKLPDLQIVRLVRDADQLHLFPRDRHHGEILMSGTLGGLMLTWEYATAVAGRILGIDPFDQPDVESAKAAARGLLESTPAPVPAAFVDEGVEVRTAGGFAGSATSLRDAITALLEQVPADGYVAIQAYVNRLALPQLASLRDLVAARCGRPVTFGWGPRFLHSTGQYHKGGPAVGVFLQITEDAPEDLPIPDRPFTFGELIQAQAAGDATVLEQHERPVLRLNLTSPEQNVATLFAAVE